MALHREEVRLRRFSTLFGIGNGVLMLLFGRLVLLDNCTSMKECGPQSYNNLWFFGSIANWPSFMLDCWELSLVLLCIVIGLTNYLFFKSSEYSQRPNEEQDVFLIAAGCFACLYCFLAWLFLVIAGWFVALYMAALAAFLMTLLGGLFGGSVFLVIRAQRYVASVWQRPHLHPIVSDVRYVGRHLSASSVGKRFRNIKRYFNAEDVPD